MQPGERSPILVLGFERLVIIFLLAFSEHLIATYLAGVAGALCGPGRIHGLSPEPCNFRHTTGLPP
jgi:hypothetical protein